MYQAYYYEHSDRQLVDDTEEATESSEVRNYKNKKHNKP